MQFVNLLVICGADRFVCPVYVGGTQLTGHGLGLFTSSSAERDENAISFKFKDAFFSFFGNRDFLLLEQL